MRSDFALFTINRMTVHRPSSVSAKNCIRLSHPSGPVGYVCMVTHIVRVWINPVRLPVLLVVS